MIDANNNACFKLFNVYPHFNWYYKLIWALIEVQAHTHYNTHYTVTVYIKQNIQDYKKSSQAKLTFS